MGEKPNILKEERDLQVKKGDKTGSRWSNVNVCVKQFVYPKGP